MSVTNLWGGGLRSLPFARRPEPRTAHPTLLGADIVGFTGMVERLGDGRSLGVIRRIDGLVRKLAHAQSGSELELQGDCFLLAFPSARAGLRCAMALQRAVTVDALAHPTDGVKLRIALHTGDMVRNRSRYFGLNVILVFRLLEAAEEAEILVSSQLRDRVTPDFADRFGGEYAFHPKGFREAVRCAPVDWSDPLPELARAAPRRGLKPAKRALHRLGARASGLSAAGS